GGVVLGEEAGEELRLLDGAGVAVEDEPVVAEPAEHLGHDRVDDLVRDELAAVHVRLRLAADGRLLLDGLPEHVAGGEVAEAVGGPKRMSRIRRETRVREPRPLRPGKQDNRTANAGRRTSSEGRRTFSPFDVPRSTFPVRRSSLPTPGPAGAPPGRWCPARGRPRRRGSRG